MHKRLDGEGGCPFRQNGLGTLVNQYIVDLPGRSQDAVIRREQLQSLLALDLPDHVRISIEKAFFHHCTKKTFPSYRQFFNNHPLVRKLSTKEYYIYGDFADVVFFSSSVRSSILNTIAEFFDDIGMEWDRYIHQATNEIGGPIEPEILDILEEFHGLKQSSMREALKITETKVYRGYHEGILSIGTFFFKILRDHYQYLADIEDRTIDLQDFMQGFSLPALLPGFNVPVDMHNAPSSKGVHIQTYGLGGYTREALNYSIANYDQRFVNRIDTSDVNVYGCPMIEYFGDIFPLFLDVLHNELESCSWNG